MSKIIQTRAFQSISLLGDIAIDLGYDAMVIAVKPEVILNCKKVTGKTSFLHLQSVNLHLELTQSTPVIQSKISPLFRQLIDITHTLLLQHNLPYGLDITMPECELQNNSSATMAYLVALYKSIIDIKKTKLSKDELLQFCHNFLLDRKIEHNLATLTAAINGGIVYFSKQSSHVETLNINDLIIYYLPQTKETAVKKAYKHIKTSKERYKDNLAQLGKLSALGIVALNKKDYLKFGEYINRTQKLLTDFGLVSETVHKLCIQAMLAGALGAKYCLDLNAVLLICDQKGVEIKSALMKLDLQVQDLPSV